MHQHHDSVSISPFADGAVCGLGNVFKAQAVYKAVLPLFFVRYFHVSSEHALDPMLSQGLVESEAISSLSCAYAQPFTSMHRPNHRLPVATSFPQLLLMNF